MSRNKKNWDALVDERGQYYNPNIGTGGGGGQKGDKGEKGGGAGQKGQKGEDGQKGTAGTNGTNGTPGTKGQKGAPGAQGDKGQKGLGDKGQKGSSGAAASKGDKGDKGQKGLGDKGDKGSSGNLAAKGDKGDAGDKGAKGSKGSTSAKGDKGEKGAKGSGQKGQQGDQGLKGQKGVKGADIQGIKGQKGEKGAPAPLLQYQGAVADATQLPAQPQPAGDTYYNISTGRYVTSDGAAYGDAGQMIKGDKGQDIKGEKGPKGTKGADAKGIKGSQGAKGQKGGDGPQGQKGDANDKGQKGVKGADITGPKGQKGQKGAPAPLLQYQGVVTNQAALPAQPQPAGDTYYSQGDGRYYSSDGSTWSDAGQMIKGDLGEKGEKGEGDKGIKGVKGQKGSKGFGQKGDAGEKGVKGEIGNVGLKGTKGEPSNVKGDAATVDAGTTTTVAHDTPASVVNSGDTSAAVFDFSIPKGEQGVKGDKGITGQIPAAGVTAHINFSGTTANGILQSSDINASYGITSVQKIGTGEWVITFDNAFSGAAEYTCVGTAGRAGDTGLATGISLLFTDQSTTTVKVFAERGDNGNQYDPDTVQCAFYGTGTGGQVVQKGEKGDAGGQKGQKGFQGPKGDKGLKGLKGLMPMGAAQAHVAFDASAGNGFAYPADVSSSFNVSNIVRNSAGNFTITFDSAFADANYTVVASAGGRDHSSVSGSNRAVNVLSRTATEVQILCESGGGNNDDSEYIAICVYGTGSQGNVATGPQGLKGEKGDFGGQKGIKGEPGEKGQKGVKGQVPAGAVTAHISFNGEAAAGQISGGDIFSSYGITNITKTGTGDYTVTFDTPFNAANSYTVQGTCGGRDFTGFTRSVNPLQMETNTCRFLVEGTGGGASDVPYVSVVFYGDGTGGAAFLKGEVGPKGTKGDPFGQKGEKGQTGLKGDLGPVGAKGDAGTDGDKGEKGQDGAAVAKGDKGNEGAAGAKGNKGEEGAFEFQTSYVSFDASAGSGFSFGTAQIARNNISTVQRLSSARYEIYFDTNYRDSNYMVQAYASDSSYTNNQSHVVVVSRGNGTMVIDVFFNSGGGRDDENPYINVLVMGRAA